MEKAIVLLEDGTVMETALEAMPGQIVTGTLQDENGNIVERTGRVVEILV